MKDVDNEKHNFALVRKPSSAVEKAAPGAKRILAVMVGETLELAQAKKISAPPVIAAAQAEGWFQTGEKYYYGRGVPQDYAEAVKWYRKAAEQGHAEAQNSLGDCYACGDPQDQDIIMDVDEVDVDQAKARFGRAVAWYRRAAESGHAAAQNSLGLGYAQGWGVPQDFTQAVAWYRKAAEQGNPIAQDRLADCYYHGNGVKQDYTQAVAWYRKAAEQGDAGAQSHLGDCYFEGFAIPKDYAQARGWYRTAADEDHYSALTMLTTPELRLLSPAELAESERLYEEYSKHKPPRNALSGR